MKKLVAIFMIVALCACLFVGCTEQRGVHEDEPFVIIEHYPGWIIYRHRETNVMYAMYCRGGASAMTVMLHPDGTPMIWEGE